MKNELTPKYKDLNSGLCSPAKWLCKPRTVMNSLGLVKWERKWIISKIPLSCKKKEEDHMLPKDGGCQGARLAGTAPSLGLGHDGSPETLRLTV